MQKGDLINFLQDKDKIKDDSSQKANNKAQMNSPMDDMDLWNIFRQVTAGIRYLHYQNIVHGDIKPQVKYIEICPQ
jgi:serine/threonine protein kinase